MDSGSVHRPALAVVLASIATALLLGCSDNVAAQTVPSMTIKIYNNTDKSERLPTSIRS